MEASPAHSDATASTTTTATTVDASALGSSLDFGKMEYGCKHYRRRCKIRAPCCNEVFTCRHCHNESVADRHELHRHDVQRVICLVCDAEQPPAQVCSNCGVNMGEYFCDICKFYDDDIEKTGLMKFDQVLHFIEHLQTEKRQYHCNDSGICGVGGRENFFHCHKCGNQDVQDEAHLGDAQGGLQREETTLESLSGEVNQIRTSLEALTLKVDSTHQSFLEYRQEFHQFVEAQSTFQQNLWDQLVFKPL